MKYIPIPNDQYTDKMAKRDKRVINKAIKEAMSNSTQNETHNVCNERLAKEGGQARCCDCEPHEGCTLGIKPTQNDWESQLSRSLKSMGLGMSGSQAEWIFDFVRQQKADARKEVIQKVMGILPLGDDPRYRELKDVLATLKEESK